MIIEMFGRNCGLTALAGGYLADADRTLIAEVPFDLGRLAELLSEDRARSTSNYTISVVSEGASIIARTSSKAARKTPMATASSAGSESGSAPG